MNNCISCEIVVPQLQEENMILRNVVRKLHHKLWVIGQILGQEESQIIEEIRRLKHEEETRTKED